MTRFWWVRHGPTHAKTLVGWTDIPADLSDTGALSRLQSALPDAPIVSSDLIRAVSTADALQGARARLPHVAGLREMHFGQWENQDPTKLDSQPGSLLRRFWEEPGETRAPGGESWNLLATRVGDAVTRLAAQGYDDIICVAHMGVILTQIQRATGGTVFETLAQTIAPLSLTRVVLDAGALRVEAVNQLP